ncbi:MAG: hypothetical protein K0U72_05670 [Gammaproteobacteria bacterium]|nr:hypothetical protein [Gammaproteobacteria bacterium]
MLKTFFLGVLLGIAAAAGALYALPVVDQQREASIISVAPNGGNFEAFHINVPMDRIMTGASEPGSELPASLEWPTAEPFSGLRAELFKIRNARDSVIGVASRMAAQEDGADVIEWVLHFPARGSLYVNMDPAAQEGGFRSGAIRAGSREFAGLNGSLTERWKTDTSNDIDAPDGRIELQARYVGELESSE